MSDLQPINEINTRLPSLSDAEAQLRKLMTSLNEFAGQLSAMPRAARKLSDACDATIGACPPGLERLADCLRVLSGLALSFSKDISGASRELTPLCDQLNRFRREVEIAARKERR
jgi:hypothetical protein